MKRKLALTMAIAMMTTLAPISAFAASDNGVSKVARVQEDEGMKESQAPRLTIENDKGHLESYEKFNLNLENAEWVGADGNELKNGEALTIDVDAASGSSVTATVYKKSDSRAEVIIKNSQEGDKFEIPLTTKVTGEGEAKVTIDSRAGGGVSDGEYTFAKVAEGDTTVDVDDTITFADTKKIKDITIDENAVGVIKDDEISYITVEADKDFKLKAGSEFKVTGDLLNKELTASVVEKEDDNKLKIEIPADAIKDDLNHRGSIQIEGLEITPGRDANEGDVDVKVKSDCDAIDSTTLNIGKFAEYDVTVEADGDATEIFAGRYEGEKSTDEAHELQKLTIEEGVEGAWVDGRSVAVEFPKEVKILSVDASGDIEKVENGDIDENVFEFTPKEASDGKKKVELTFYVSVEAAYEGDINAKVESRGLDEDYEVTLGKAVAPVTIKAESAKIKAGVRDQEVGKITIAETKEESIKEGQLVVELDDDLEWDGEPDVEVTKGDLEIGDIDVDDNILTIDVDDTSDEASTIEITNAKVKVDRSIAQGAVEAKVKGDAIIENGYDKELDETKKEQLDAGKFAKDYVAQVEVANVITPADGDTSAAEPAQFVIGQAGYKVGEEAKQADVAPYIKDGRTMLSLRYVAEALGVSEQNIVWDNATRTVTVFKGDRVAQVQIGSNKLMVGGVPVIMDTVAEIKDGRTMLPVSFVAKALGAKVEWDAATRTVTIR